MDLDDFEGGLQSKRKPSKRDHMYHLQGAQSIPLDGLDLGRLDERLAEIDRLIDEMTRELRPEEIAVPHIHLNELIHLFEETFPHH